MKKATYTLIVEFEGGDKLRRGGLTQTECYEIINRREKCGWYDFPTDANVTRWKIETPWQETSE
jgi:hypothetical protein